MSLWRDEVGSPRSSLVAVAALAVVAAMSFGRSFTTNEHLWWTLPALAIGAGLAVTLGRRALGLTFAGLVVVTWATLPVLFARETTALGLPTPSGLAHTWDLLGRGVQGMLHETAPVVPETRFMVLLWVAGLLLGYLGGSWVVVGRPIGAIVTGLMMLGYAGQVGVGPGRTAYGFAAVVVTIAFFLLEGRHRIAAWGRERKPLPAYIGLPTLAVASLIALASPMVLGATNPLIDLQGGLQPRLVIIKPLSDVRRQLEIDPPLEVMRVTANAATYWRLTALDTYQGDEWVLEARPVPVPNGPVPRPQPPVVGPVVEQRYSITSLLSPWLPAAFAAEAVDSPVAYEIDEDSSTLLLSTETVPGLQYSVVSRVPDRSANDSASGARHKPDEVEKAFGRAAEQVVGTGGSVFERAVELEEWFRSFTYDEKVPGGHDVARLDRFLQEQRGYCEQFAATMTLMLRGLGIPARVAVGFLPGAARESEYLVTTDDAHAWVEAHVPGRGWVSFDPTPGRGMPNSPDGELEQPVSTPTPRPAEPTEGEPTPEPTPTVAPTDPGGGTDPQGPGLPILQLVMGATLVGAIPGAKAIRRTRRRSAGALGAYDELIDRAADLGLRPGRTETPWEFWRRVGGGPQTGTVVATAVQALYAPDPVTRQEADEAWSSLPTAVKALGSRIPAWRRVAGLWDPRTLVPESVRSAATTVLARLAGQGA
ncbi:MAG TPA: DUF3488 and transglutaminase-like domain-containing protein [Actinomycetota bacterium]|nr:DUF3488 and transglutaminase-like domain-containing protein [Actinomycetota bacterium]